MEMQDCFKFYVYAKSTRNEKLKLIAMPCTAFPMKALSVIIQAHISFAVWNEDRSPSGVEG